MLLLKRGGYTIYYGKLSELVKHFESIRGVKSMDPDANPATYMLEVSTKAEEERLGLDFAEIYNEALLQPLQERIKPFMSPYEGSSKIQSAGNFATGCVFHYGAYSVCYRERRMGYCHMSIKPDGFCV